MADKSISQWHSFIEVKEIRLSFALHLKPKLDMPGAVFLLVNVLMIYSSVASSSRFERNAVLSHENSNVRTDEHVSRLASGSRNYRALRTDHDDDQLQGPPKEPKQSRSGELVSVCLYDAVNIQPALYLTQSLQVFELSFAFFITVITVGTLLGE